jgi:hypothetical protein
LRYHAGFKIAILPYFHFGNLDIWQFPLFLKVLNFITFILFWTVIFCPKYRASESRGKTCFDYAERSRYSLPEKKEYAKLAISLTGSKGQALRVFGKKSPHLRYASGSIFFQKTLTAAATLLFNLHIFFSSFALFSFSFRGKK